MLIDTGLTIAYKCSICGSYEFFNTSLFAISNRDGRVFCCRCKKTCLKIKTEPTGRAAFYMPCIGCGNEHEFIIRKDSLLSRNLSVIHCPQTGTPLCFVGNDADVRKTVDKTERELDELIDMFGYDNYFQNNQVMLDTLNRIHDIAEYGNLSCECGNRDIELVLLSDRVLLKCKSCGAEKTIKAASNEDLKETMIEQHILICGKTTEIKEEKLYTIIKD